VTSVSTVGAKKVPRRKLAGQPLAAEDEAGALADRVADVLVHLGQGALVDQRADGDAFVQAVAGLEAADPVGEHGQELRRDGAVHEDPVRADAGLAGVQELDQRRAAGRVGWVGVREHDERRVPAKLQRDALDLAAAPWASILPTSVEPVKVSLRTTGLLMNSSPTT
jgi:hypothetical protein